MTTTTTTMTTIDDAASSTPKISVIVPIYPSIDFFHRLLDSLRRQNVILNVIAVLDGIEEKEKQISLIKEYEDLNLTFLQHNRNRSALQARITGAKEATGDWIAFVDCDDEISDNTFHNCLIAAKKHPDVDIIGYHLSVSKKNKKFIMRDKNKIMLYCRKKTSIWNGTISNYIFKKDVVDKGISQLNVNENTYLNFGEVDLLFTAFCSVSNSLLENHELGQYIYHTNNGSITKAPSTRTYAAAHRKLAEILIDDYCNKHHC